MDQWVAENYSEGFGDIFGKVVSGAVAGGGGESGKVVGGDEAERVSARDSERDKGGGGG